MLYIVRHGETEWNAANKILGRTDLPLNDKGREQALEIARSLKDVKIDVFLCSPLCRTMQTADAVSDETGIPYKTDDRLIEQDFGKFEGADRSDTEYQKAKREYFARYPGGESFFDLAARVYPLIKELNGKNALLVTHGGICRVIRSYFEDMGNEEFVQFSQGNCEVRVYDNMKSILIRDTTKEEREQIVAESIGNIDGSCDGCAAGLAEMYQDYIDGKKEIRDINMEFCARRSQQGEKQV